MTQKFLLIVGNFIKFGCVTLSGVILSRHFSKIELGTYLQGVLLIATVSEIAAWGLPKAILYFGRIEKDLKNLILHVLLMITVTASMFGTVLWFMRDQIGSLFSNPALSGLALAMILNLVFRTLNIALGSIMMITGKVGLMTLAYVLSSAVNLAVFGVLAYRNGSVQSLFVSSLLIEVAQSVFFMAVFLSSKIDGGFALNTRMAGSILKYSSPMMLNILIIMAGRKLDSFLVSGFFNPEEYAIYSRGALELPFSQMILVTIASLLMPEFSRLFHEKRSGELSSLLRNEIVKISLLIFPMFFGLLLVHRDLIVFLYSEQYISSAQVFLVYLLLVPIQLYSFDSILQAFNKSIWVNISSIAYVASNLAIGVSLIPYLGVLGPAIGVLCGTFINAAFNIYLINRFLGNPFHAWLPWASLGRVLVLAGIPLIVIWPVSHFLPDKAVIGLSVKSLVYYPVAFAVMWRFGAIPDEHREQLKGYLGKLSAGFSSR